MEATSSLCRPRFLTGRADYAHVHFEGTSPAELASREADSGALGEPSRTV